MRYAAAFNSGSTDSFEPGGYLTDYWTDEAIKVIENNRHRPFFLYLAHWGVHTPLQATKEDYEAVGDIKPHRLRVYAAMVLVSAAELLVSSAIPPTTSSPLSRQPRRTR